MKDLIKLLHEGNYSCVIKNGGEIRTFSNRGVKDLHLLLQHDPEFLRGAAIADKVIGKAAATLIILGGVNELYTDLISNPALQILEQQHIKTSYQKKVEVILNRTQNDWCPLERLCFNENSLEANLKNIGDFIN